MKNKLFPTALIGSWPRKKKVLMARRQLTNGLISQKQFDELIEFETKRIIEKQDKLGLDIIVSGELSRDNYASFVADRIGGATLMSMNDVIDYMPDKKAFEDILSVLDVPSISIKNAICTGKLEHRPIALEELKLLKKYTKKRVKITLPGPYLLTRSMWLPELSQKVYANKEELGEAVVELLKKEVSILQEYGVDIIQFDEPVLTEVVFTKGKTRSFMCAALSEKKDPKEELEFAKYLIASVFKSIDRNKSIASLHVCRGNWSKDESILLKGSYTPLVPLFEEIQADMLTLEFSTPRAGELSSLLSNKYIAEKCVLGLGVENPRMSESETVGFIVDKVNQALEFLPKERIYLNPDCGFATFANRPVNEEQYIENKIKALVESSNYLREKNNG